MDRRPYASGMELILGLFVLVALAGVSVRWGADSRDYVKATATWPFRSRNEICLSSIVPEAAVSIEISDERRSASKQAPIGARKRVFGENFVVVQQLNGRATDVKWWPPATNELLAFAFGGAFVAILFCVILMAKISPTPLGFIGTVIAMLLLTAVVMSAVSWWRARKLGY